MRIKIFYITTLVETSEQTINSIRERLKIDLIIGTRPNVVWVRIDLNSRNSFHPDNKANKNEVKY